MSNAASKKQNKVVAPETPPDSSSDEDEAPKPMVRRTSSAAMAPFITKFEPYEPEEYVVDKKNGIKSPARLEKIAIVGSGSWGTALARVAALNAAGREGFDPEVRIWVREHEVWGLNSHFTVLY